MWLLETAAGLLKAYDYAFKSTYMRKQTGVQWQMCRSLIKLEGCVPAVSVLAHAGSTCGKSTQLSGSGHTSGCLASQANAAADFDIQAIDKTKEQPGAAVCNNGLGNRDLGLREFYNLYCGGAGEPAAAVRVQAGQPEQSAVAVVGLRHALRRRVQDERAELQRGVR